MIEKLIFLNYISSILLLGAKYDEGVKKDIDFNNARSIFTWSTSSNRKWIVR